MVLKVVFKTFNNQEERKMTAAERIRNSSGVERAIMVTSLKFASTINSLETKGVLSDGNWEGDWPFPEGVGFITKPRPVCLEVENWEPAYRQCTMTVKFRDRLEWFCRISLYYSPLYICGEQDGWRWWIEKIGVPNKIYQGKELRAICQAADKWHSEPWIPFADVNWAKVAYWVYGGVVREYSEKEITKVQRAFALLPKIEKRIFELRSIGKRLFQVAAEVGIVELTPKRQAFSRKNLSKVRRLEERAIRRLKYHL